jgi:hypothetical protein
MSRSVDNLQRILYHLHIVNNYCAVHGIGFCTDVLIQIFVKLGMVELLRFRETS